MLWMLCIVCILYSLILYVQLIDTNACQYVRIKKLLLLLLIPDCNYLMEKHICKFYFICADKEY